MIIELIEPRTDMADRAGRVHRAVGVDVQLHNCHTSPHLIVLRLKLKVDVRLSGYSLGKLKQPLRIRRFYM